MKLVYMLAILVLCTNANALTIEPLNTEQLRMMSPDTTYATLKDFATSKKSEYKEKTSITKFAFYKYSITQFLIFGGAVASVIQPAVAAGVTSVSGIIADQLFYLPKEYVTDKECFDSWNVIEGAAQLNSGDDNFKNLQARTNALIERCP